MRNRFVDTVLAAAGCHADLLFLSGDAGLGVFDEVREQAPSRFLNLGVAEQNMAAFAAGLALTGSKVYLYNIIPFLLYRCYEQVRNDLCYQRLPVVLVGVGSGVTYAPAGMSHYAVEDLGIAATLPNLTVVSPCDAREAEAAARFSLAAEGPVYVRLAKRGGADLHPGPLGDLALPQVLRRGPGCALVFHGSIGGEVAVAADLLARRGVAVDLVSVPLLQPLDADRLFAILAGHRLVVTVEEHVADTGLGGLVARLAGERRPPWRHLARGFPSRFLHEVHDAAGMRRRYRLDAESVAADVAERLDA